MKKRIASLRFNRRRVTNRRVARDRDAKQRSLIHEPLESRLCMTASVGWDGPGLGSAELTYYIDSRGSGLSAAATEQAIETALESWSEVVDIEFTQTNTPNLHDSIDFEFGPIDSKGKILAQAYFPDDVNPARIAGDVKFDSSESWEVGNRRGSSAFDLTLVAAHEIGHALGIDHLEDFGSVMHDSVGASQSFSGFKTQDVDAALQLYSASDSVTADPPSSRQVSLEDTTVVEPETVSDPPVNTPPVSRGRWSWGVSIWLSNRWTSWRASSFSVRWWMIGSVNESSLREAADDKGSRNSDPVITNFGGNSLFRGHSFIGWHGHRFR